jgi:hypothetical protein
MHFQIFRYTSIPNGAESTYNLGPDRLGPERPETKITTDIIRVRGYVAMFICKEDYPSFIHASISIEKSKQKC